MSPQDVGVVGFSNWQFTEFTTPTVTTIDQRGFEMGQIATELLLKELNSKAENYLDPEEVKLTTRLIARGSSMKKYLINGLF